MQTCTVAVSSFNIPPRSRFLAQGRYYFSVFLLYSAFVGHIPNGGEKEKEPEKERQMEGMGEGRPANT